MIRQLFTATLIAGLVLTPVGAASATPLDVSSTFPNFANPDDLSIGEDAEVGDTFDYEGVLVAGGVTVDARITVLAVDGFIGIVDAAESDDSSPWPYLFSQLKFQEDANGGGKVRYLIEFTDSATGDPAVLTGLRAVVRDVDETQYIQASEVKSYSLSSTPTTELSVITPNDNATVTEGEIRFASPSIGIDPSDEDYWVSLSFEDVSSFTLELGQGDYDEFEWAYYYVDFEAPSWTVEPTDTDTPPLTRDPDLADTGVADSSLLLSVLAAIGLLTVGIAIRRRIS
jgi:hypothetical protein